MNMGYFLIMDWQDIQNREPSVYVEMGKCKTEDEVIEILKFVLWDASDHEVKIGEAVRRLSLMFHPDKVENSQEIDSNTLDIVNKHLSNLRDLKNLSLSGANEYFDKQNSSVTSEDHKNSTNQTKDISIRDVQNNLIAGLRSLLLTNSKYKFEANSIHSDFVGIDSFTLGRSNLYLERVRSQAVSTTRHKAFKHLEPSSKEFIRNLTKVETLEEINNLTYDFRRNQNSTQFETKEVHDSYVKTFNNLKSLITEAKSELGSNRLEKLVRKIKDLENDYMQNSFGKKENPHKAIKEILNHIDKTDRHVKHDKLAFIKSYNEETTDLFRELSSLYDNGNFDIDALDCFITNYENPITNSP